MGAQPDPSCSLSPRQLLGFPCAEVSGLSTERVRELAVALAQKNVKLSAEQVSLSWAEAGGHNWG